MPPDFEMFIMPPVMIKLAQQADQRQPVLELAGDALRVFI
jgi:hypothetical protein